MPAFHCKSAQNTGGSAPKAGGQRRKRVARPLKKAVFADRPSPLPTYFFNRHRLPRLRSPLTRRQAASLSLPCLGDYRWLQTRQRLRWRPVEDLTRISAGRSPPSQTDASAVHFALTPSPERRDRPTTGQNAADGLAGLPLPVGIVAFAGLTDLPSGRPFKVPRLQNACAAWPLSPALCDLCVPCG